MLFRSTYCMYPIHLFLPFRITFPTCHLPPRSSASPPWLIPYSTYSNTPRLIPQFISASLSRPILFTPEINTGSSLSAPCLRLFLHRSDSHKPHTISFLPFCASRDCAHLTLSTILMTAFPSIRGPPNILTAKLAN